MEKTGLDTSRMIILTDLDGTLLDRDTYSYSDAVDAMHLVRENNVPLVFCSSKTRAEQELYQRELCMHDPFIVEDGGGIFIEETYFSFPYTFHKTYNGYRIIELGRPYQEIRRIILQVATETGLNLRGYADLTAREVADLTGLDLQSAALAMDRAYQEKLVGNFDSEEIDVLSDALAKHGLVLTHGGRFYGVSGHPGKGKAVRELASLYQRQRGDIYTVGIGDSHNDLDLLSVVDMPVLIKKKNGTWEDMDIPDIRRVDGIGPAGWNTFVLQLLK